MMRRAQGEEGNATVEMVLLAPVLLALLALVVAAGRILTIKSDVEALARETARSASQASSAEDAFAIVQVRKTDVAAELGLDPARLNLRTDVGDFERGFPMSVRATYQVLLDDLPAFGLFPGSFEISARHVEIVERFKSR